MAAEIFETFSGILSMVLCSSIAFPFTRASLLLFALYQATLKAEVHPWIGPPARLKRIVYIFVGLSASASSVFFWFSSRGLRLTGVKDIFIPPRFLCSSFLRFHAIINGVAFD